VERKSPTRTAPRYGNRDWVIAIECRADGLVLTPTGQRIGQEALGPTDRADPLLLTAVKQMIARRQATVRPGEPPYRPLIRFQVRPEGLRLYFLAYPLLEPLGVPMSREDLYPTEDKTRAAVR
jgi:hypothetical protein